MIVHPAVREELWPMPGGLYDAWIRAVVSSEEIAAQPDPLAEWIDTGEHRYLEDRLREEAEE